MSYQKRKSVGKDFDKDARSTSFVEVEDRIIKQQECVGHSKTLIDGFSRLKSEGKICNFVIIIEGEEIPVHRAVLAASSKYYEAMVTHDTAEREKGRVEIQDVTLKAGRQCIEFMYTGKASFSLENPEDLIHAAELMELPALTDLYFDFLKENLCTNDCLKYLQLAETFSSRPHAEIFKKFSVKNFVDIVDCEELPNLSLALMEECLKAVPASGRQSETAKWVAIITWVNADIEKRQEAFLDLFGILELKYFSESFLRDQILTEPIVKYSLEAKEMILNAVLDPTKSMPDARAFSENVKYIIYCHSESRMLHRYNVDIQRVSRFARIPFEVYEKHIDIVSVNGEVFLTSGNTISKFRDGELIHLVSTGCESEYHQCVAHGSMIYVVSKQRTCKFQSNTNKWTVLPTGTQLGEGFCITSSSSFIYAMGGEGTENTAKEFDFNTETWERIASLQLGRIFGAAVWYDQKVYALGGREDQYSNRIEFYSPPSNVWRYLSKNINCSHYKCKAFTIGSEVFIIGGVKSRGRWSDYQIEECENCKIVSTRNPAPSMAKLDFKKATITPLSTFQTDCGLSCAVYYD